MKNNKLILLPLILLSCIFDGCKKEGDGELDIEAHLLNYRQSINNISSFDFSFKEIMEPEIWGYEFIQKYSYDDKLNLGYYKNGNDISRSLIYNYDYYMMFDDGDYYELYNNDMSYSKVNKEDDAYLCIDRLSMFNNYVKDEIEALNKQLLELVYDVTYERYTYCNVLNHTINYIDNRLEASINLERIDKNDTYKYDLTFTFEDYVLTSFKCDYFYSVEFYGMFQEGNNNYEITFSNKSNLEKVDIKDYSKESNLKDEINMQYGYNIEPFLSKVTSLSKEINRINYEITAKDSETTVRKYSFDKYKDQYSYVELVNKKKTFEYYLVIENNEYIEYNAITKTRRGLKEEEFNELKNNIVDTVLVDIKGNSYSMGDEIKVIYSNNLFDCVAKVSEDYKKGELYFNDLYLVGYDFMSYNIHYTLNVNYNEPVKLPSFEGYIGG